MDIVEALIQPTADTTEEWEKNNPVILDGVLTTEILDSGIRKQKIGDGITPWKDLPYTGDPVIANHSQLSGLDYGSSGHTGFASTEELREVIDAHNDDDAAHEDIRTDLTTVSDNLDTVAVKVDAIEGSGGYVHYTNFGVATPEQADITAYVKTQIWPENTENHADAEIFNGTRVTNDFDGVTWILANTTDTDPPVFTWEAAGNFSVAIGNEDTAGLIRSSPEPLEITINPVSGKGSVNGLSQALAGNVSVDPMAAYNAWVTLDPGNNNLSYTDWLAELIAPQMLLLNRPDLWEVGSEYSFGEKLYGQRFTGTITVVANKIYSGVIAIFSGKISIIDCQGWVNFGYNADASMGIGMTMPGEATGRWATVMTTGIGDVTLYTSSAYARTNAPYDICIKYIKKY